ncbi:30S ribosome-binding factor RbfA [Dysgonomonas sp. 520]|uniref:30S ribosome-binding factor RbfA n=1 Tax=Dysgonomonas sp. 520 TaxID=2302931 RepID=UPI0013D22358|nr:30S ribosome-binding factor RbfA [Dysgonomonas sp. 520]NDW08196.1 30S ribosome-binding factor RbfA [Dysgonomonas sp. 520]
MESTRQQKINRLIQKELGDIFLLQTKQMTGVLVSVSSVRISPDLGVAKAYLSIFPSEKGAELLKNINANVKAIRYDIGQRLGKQLRIIPEFTFFLDDSLDYLDNIDRLLNKDNKTEDKNG